MLWLVVIEGCVSIWSLVLSTWDFFPQDHFHAAHSHHLDAQVVMDAMGWVESTVENSLKLTFLHHLKMDGWNTSSRFLKIGVLAYFQVVKMLLVSGRLSMPAF